MSWRPGVDEQSLLCPLGKAHALRLIPLGKKQTNNKTKQNTQKMTPTFWFVPTSLNKGFNVWHYFKHFSEKIQFQVRMSFFPTQLFAKGGSIKCNFITNNSLATSSKSYTLSQHNSLHFSKTLVVIETVQRGSDKILVIFPDFQLWWNCWWRGLESHAVNHVVGSMTYISNLAR